MTRTSTLNAILATATIGVASAFAIPAMAQDTTAPAAPDPIVEGELDAFAVAYKDVVAIEQEYGAQLQQTQDEAEQQALIQEAQAEMTQAVEDAPDIEVNRYIEIMQLAQADPELQAELTEMLQSDS